jgi:hypothetical protein
VTNELQKIRTAAYAGFEKCSLEIGGCAKARRRSLMMRRIGAAILAVTLMLDGSALINSDAATPLRAAGQRPHVRQATDLSARGHTRHHNRYAYHSYYRPYYYDRPYYYTPAPYVPFNFGYDFWPWW